MKKVFVAMSGGVDSSVAALMLKDNGYEVVGVTMCLGVKPDEESEASCCGPQAVDDARKVCDKLEIRHYVMDFSRELQDKVIDNFIEEYSAGRTPNPCVNCNKHLKFDTLLKKAIALGFDFLATGHYAKIESINGDFFLKKPKDIQKDQTYFLYSIQKQALSKLLFPLAGFTKDEVRKIALNAKLPVATKHESQDICFVNGNYREFITNRLKPCNTGDIVDTEGNIIGQHNGVLNYTIGQRRGLGIAAGKPIYVTSINPQKNRITVGGKESLMAYGLIADEINLFKEDFPDSIQAKIRYLHPQQKCKALILNDGKLSVIFNSKQKAITPGQSIVLYDGDTVLGGGIIETVLKNS